MAKSEKHLAFIRSLPCLICDNNTMTEACHVRFTDLRAGKINPGIGKKPEDRWTVPLCSAHHRDQHKNSEKRWWAGHGIDPVFVALSLWGATGNFVAASEILTINRGNAHELRGEASKQLP